MRTHTSFLLLSVTIVVISVILSLLFSSSQVEAHDSGDAVELTPKTMGKFLSTHKAVYVAIVASYCGHCKQMMPDFHKFARAMKGTVKVGWIDGNTHQSIAQKFQVQGFPTIKKWAMGPKKGKSPSDYVGPRAASSFQSDALSMIQQKYKVALSTDDMSQAIQSVSTKKAFVLVTNKDKIAPLFSVLSFSPHYDGKVAFVVVKSSSTKGKALVSALGNPKLPAMYVYAESESDGKLEIVEEYSGAVEYDAIAKYVLNIAKGGEASSTEPAARNSDGGDGATGDASTATNEQQQEQEEEKPQEKKVPKKPLPVRVETLEQSVVDNFCSGSAIGRKQPFCVVLFKEGDGANAERVHEYFDKEPVLFFTGFSADVLSSVSSTFPDGAPTTSEALRALVFRTTKTAGVTKYVWLDAQTDGDLQNGISSILEGLRRMKASDGGLPKL